MATARRPMQVSPRLWAAPKIVHAGHDQLFKVGPPIAAYLSDCALRVRPFVDPIGMIRKFGSRQAGELGCDLA